jgi:outer membrane protein assembly factor BamB
MKLKKLVVLASCCLWLLAPSWAKEPLWKIDLATEIAGSPAFHAGQAVVATKGGLLVALDVSGKIAWKQKLPGGCLAAPAVDLDGSIYVACADGSLLRFSAAGRQVWQAGLEQELLATPLLAGDALFVFGGQGRAGKVRKADGAVLKRVELGLPFYSSPVWDAGRKFLLVPVKDYYLCAIDPELELRWKFKTVGVNYSSPAVTPGNEIYLTSMDHHLYKLNADGGRLWEFAARGWIKASPVIDERGRVYFGSYDRGVYAVSKDGRLLWRFQGKAQFTASAAIDGAGDVYCGDTSGTVYALDRDGRLAWEYKSPDFITGDMAILPEKILLAGSIDGTLLAFRVGRPLSLKAWWAKYLGNLSNSGFDEE